MTDVMLVERLRVRLAEIEEIARTASTRWPPRLTHDRPQSKAAIALMKIHDPAYVLRTIQAHRRIVDLYASSTERDDMMRAHMGTAPLRTATSAYREALLAVAAIYLPDIESGDTP